MNSEGISLIWQAVIFAIVVMLMVFSITPVIVQQWSKRRNHFYQGVASGREVCSYRGCDRDAETTNGLCNEHNIWFTNIFKKKES